MYERGEKQNQMKSFLLQPVLMDNLCMKYMESNAMLSVVMVVSVVLIFIGYLDVIWCS